MTKANQLMPKDFFTALDFWKDLTPEERQVVEKETKGLSDDLGRAVELRLSMGEHLMKLQAVLEPRREFKKYLGTLKFSRRKGYRLIEVFKAVKKALPDYAIRLAAARNIDLAGYSASKPFGAYQEPLKRVGPPSSEADVGAWLDRLEADRQSHPSRRSKKTKEPDEALIEAFRACAGRFRHVPAGRTRTQWALRLLSIMMGEFGIPAQTIKPEAVPEGFRPQVGRPRVKK